MNVICSEGSFATRMYCRSSSLALLDPCAEIRHPPAAAKYTSRRLSQLHPGSRPTYTSLTMIERSSEAGLVPDEPSNVKMAFMDRPWPCSSARRAAWVGLIVSVGAEAPGTVIDPLPKTPVWPRVP